MKRAYWIGASACTVIALAALSWWWQRQVPAPLPPVAVAPPAIEAPASAPAVSPPAIAHPIESAAVEAGAAPLDVGAALIELFGRKNALAMFQLDDFPRRFVATVDNLGRPTAPARLWPANPAKGRFVVVPRAGAPTISADNGLRYTPFVVLLESVDMRRAAATYVRLYPMFQQAYEDLGYPGRYFNDRLVAVIDSLLATPEPDAPLQVHLPPINGPVQPERPWVLWEFDDPALQALPAGQKVLLRMGPVNERRVKARLTELRRLVTAGAQR